MPTTTNTNEICAAILNGRKFGVEIEFVGISREAAVSIISAVPGVRCRREVTYNHVDSNSHWKVVTDGSVSPGANFSYEQCGEVVSPILSGREGLEQLRAVVKALAQAGATANRSCGLHVHVDAADLTGAQYYNVMTRYAQYEGEIDNFMPNSRRRNNNHFCRSMIDELRNVRVSVNGSTSAAAVSRQFGGNRYLKVNPVAYNAHHTIEFRQHSGSVNADKICNWAQFCVNFVEASRSALAGGSSSRQPASGTRRGRVSSGQRTSRTHRKMAVIVSELQSHQYRSAEVLAAACTRDTGTHTGVTSVVVMISNLRRQFGWGIRKIGGHYTVTRQGRNPLIAVAAVDQLALAAQNAARRNSRSTAGAAVMPASSDSGLFAGLPAHIVAFYQERAQELAA